MILPPITNKQKQILNLLYKFRYLTVIQLQQYYNHKDRHRIKEWLKDLKDKKYISAIVDKTDITKPYIYCLATQARHILKENENCDRVFLNRIYKEKSLTKTFINHCLFIVDIYLFFVSQQEKNTKLTFCTQQDIKGYDYLPEELPDVYISVETEEKTTRYFLDLFDDYRKQAGISRFAVRKYINYCEDGSWQANTGNSPFPTLLFVLTDERRKKHIYHYGKAKLAKTFEEISLFVATQDAIRFSKGKINIWKIVD